MKKITLLVLLLLSILACKKDNLASEFDCKTSTTNAELKEYRDILKKFKIKLPKNWKTQLYYDDYQSEIYSADTTKSLTDTYIIDIAWHQGELSLDEEFEKTVKDTLAIKEQLTVEKANFSKFHNKPCYWTLSKGNANNYAYSNLQVYIKTGLDEYFTVTAKIYGNTNVDERLCEAIRLSENMQFIE